MNITTATASSSQTKWAKRLLIAVLILLGLSYIQREYYSPWRLNVAIEKAKDRQERIENLKLLTIETAPLLRLRGNLYRKIGGGWTSGSPTKAKTSDGTPGIRSLNANDFDVVFSNGHGHDWSFRWQNGKGYWVGDSGSNDLMDLVQGENRGTWYGSMIDTDKSETTAIPIKIVFEVY